MLDASGGGLSSQPRTAPAPLAPPGGKAPRGPGGAPPHPGGGVRQPGGGFTGGSTVPGRSLITPHQQRALDEGMSITFGGGGGGGTMYAGGSRDFDESGGGRRGGIGDFGRGDRLSGIPWPGPRRPRMPGPPPEGTPNTPPGTVPPPGGSVVPGGVQPINPNILPGINPSQDGTARTGDFQDSDRNGVDDRDQAPAGGGAAQPPNWYDRLWETTQNRPEFQSIDPTMPEATQNLMGGAGDLAQEMLRNPSRYDTDLFNTLLDSGMSRLSQAQEKDRLDLLRDSNRRLGPQSGQLTNEYIDLGAEYDRNRHDFVSGLAREAALTQSQDRLAALSGARGVAGDVYGQERGLRDEQRGEREAGNRDRLQQIGELEGFGQVDRQLGRDAMDDYFRHVQTEQGLNESKARLQQGEFSNSLALAALYNQLGAGVGGTPEGGDPMEDVHPALREGTARKQREAELTKQLEAAGYRGIALRAALRMLMEKEGGGN